MAGRNEETAPYLNKVQIGSWIPSTPAKPHLPTQLLICDNWQENHSVQPNWLVTERLTQADQVNQPKCSESGKFQGDYLQEMSCDLVPALSDWTNFNNVGDLEAWQVGEAADSHVHRDNLCSFNTWQTGEATISHPSRILFDLNSSPLTINDPALINSKSSQFEPITPEKTNKAEYRQESVVLDFNIDGVNVEKDSQEKRQLRKRVKNSKLVGDQFTQLLENYNLDKGGNKEDNLIRTPQQKPRRRKHRPKVLTVGRPKRTPKPKKERPITPKKTTRVRKCIKREGLSITNGIPSEGESSGTDSSDEVPSSKDTTVGTRKYGRRKRFNKPEPKKNSTPKIRSLKSIEETRSSCRRYLNLDIESLVREESSPCCTSANSDMEMQAAMEVLNKKNQVGGYELTSSSDHVLEEYLSRPNRQTSSPSPYKKMDFTDGHMLAHRNIFTRGKCQTVFSDALLCKEEITEKKTLNSSGCWTPKSPSDSNRSSTCMTGERQAGGLKRQYMNNNDGTTGMHFPAIYKKKRTDKRHNNTKPGLNCTMIASDNQVKLGNQPHDDSCAKLSTSRANQGSLVSQSRPPYSKRHFFASDKTRNEEKISKCLLVLGPTEWIKKKRSKGPTRVRKLASLIEVCKQLQASSCNAAPISRIDHKIGNPQEKRSCMEALTADVCLTVTKKKRSQRSMLINSTTKNMSNQQKVSCNPEGQIFAIIWKRMSPIDSVIKKLNQLDLNAGSPAPAQKQNAFVQHEEKYALVPYQRSGAVVPFDSLSDQDKRKQLRPKVDVDDETMRVWKLLLENIVNEGIEGMDEDRRKWWEEERRVFNGRADSFIARMHLIQGDRRFSQWKGSVVDSVIGVFLTQNVSDHLSSSAFMSLAAHFPLKSKTNLAELYDEKEAMKVEEPEACVLDAWETFTLNTPLLNKPICGADPKILQDFDCDDIKIVNTVEPPENNFDDIIPQDDSRGLSSEISTDGPVVSTESVTIESMNLIGDQRELDDALSSQTSVISSQNSIDSPIVQTGQRTESYLLSTSEEDPTAEVEPNKFSSATSFVKLLRMAGTILHGVSEKGSHGKMSNVNREAQPERLTFSLQNENHFTCPANPMMSYNFTSSMKGDQEPEWLDLCHKNIKFTATANRKGLSTAEVLEESAPQTTSKKSQDVSCKENSKLFSPNDQSSNNYGMFRDPNIVETQIGQEPTKRKIQESKNKFQGASDITVSPQNLTDVTGRSNNINQSKMSNRKEANSDTYDPNYRPSKLFNGQKSKEGTIRKEKRNPVDWDGLRKHGQAGGKVREEMEDTLDSVDWDAVRCAGVNEIAQIIKDRGMNNMLAKRIKDFLNRLVKDHGSTDLEWLRDVPPDKAKEYLLSINGLGLKSVECVRLLTLRQLAFPVDTNVGRISVRLGWVPLQPLPESLQLHLLELYPVLESIQKYLWPRLCKLDQRTLYELHYQMITFGKVFCTKNKPNCNACPMRGECRHFASAFASARLALPAPEEKSIMRASVNEVADQKAIRGLNTLQLPSPQVNQTGANFKVSNTQPIIEEPTTPEPITEVPETPGPGHVQVPEFDIENTFHEDLGEIPTIQLNMEEFTHNLQNIIQQRTELQEEDMSKALVALNYQDASIPFPKLKNVSQLRTEHQVYELPDSHPLLERMDKREKGDPSPYLLAIWTPGETLDSIEPPKRRCSFRDSKKLCTEETCVSCNSIREADSQTVRGTLLIPCRTAMRGSFPLNGTYFQVNEVFSDHESSLNPMDVPRQWLWNMPRRTVYFGTSIPTIFKGLSTEGIQHCFWRGFVCVRGFDRRTRAPRPVIARLHFPASKLVRKKGKMDED